MNSHELKTSSEHICTGEIHKHPMSPRSRDIILPLFTCTHTLGTFHCSTPCRLYRSSSSERGLELLRGLVGSLIRPSTLLSSMPAVLLLNSDTSDSNCSQKVLSPSYNKERFERAGNSHQVDKLTTKKLVEAETC